MVAPNSNHKQPERRVSRKEQHRRSKQIIRDIISSPSGSVSRVRESNEANKGDGQQLKTNTTPTENIDKTATSNYTSLRLTVLPSNLPEATVKQNYKTPAYSKESRLDKTTDGVSTALDDAYRKQNEE